MLLIKKKFINIHFYLINIIYKNIFFIQLKIVKPLYNYISNYNIIFI